MIMIKLSEYKRTGSALNTTIVGQTGTVNGRWKHVLIGTFIAAGLSACSGEGKGTAGPGPHSGPLPSVGVVTVAPQNVGLQDELPGRLEASRLAQVRARVAGVLNERVFQEGSEVKAGQLLFRIDSAPYDATLASAQAQLVKAQANFTQAQTLLERYKPLVAEKAVSQQDFTNAEMAFRQAQAEVAVAQAQLQSAQINRGYADVHSPINGRIGRALVTQGALVGQGDATPLAVVQQIDPLYVNFTQPAAEVMRLQRALTQGSLQKEKGTAAVTVLLEDGTEYPVKGKLLFTDLSVDASTGQVALRAEIPNPKGELLPGLFVRVRLSQAQARDVFLLPQQAVTRSGQGDTVMVVGADGKVEQRAVKVDGQQGGQWMVREGLKPGEQVVADGFQKLMGATEVKAVPWQAVQTN